MYENAGLSVRNHRNAQLTAGEHRHPPTPTGKLIFHVFAALAEFERDLIVERTQAGLTAARARGRTGGRPAVMTTQKLVVAREMYDSREHTVAAIAKTLGVSRASIYRHLSPIARPEDADLVSPAQPDFHEGL